jgi:hypothetical protein
MSDLEVKVYLRKPFTVDAVRVTARNMPDVAVWCDGNIIETVDGPKIKVNVKRPLSPKQTIANIGDWVLSSDSGFKVYTAPSFENNFDPVESVEISIVDILNGFSDTLKYLRKKL